MYTVYGLVATRTFRVLWMLEELGAEYDLHQLAPRSDEVIARNNTGKVPVLDVDGVSLTDSTAILTYLADKSQMLTYPAGSLDRAKQDAMTHKLLDELDSVIWTGARHSFVLPKDKRVPEVKESLKWEFARNLDLLGERIQGPFVMGDKMTIPDIILTHCLNWAHSANFPTGDERMQDYAKSMRARDAFQKVAALSKG